MKTINVSLVLLIPLGIFLPQISCPPWRLAQVPPPLQGGLALQFGEKAPGWCKGAREDLGQRDRVLLKRQEAPELFPRIKQEQAGLGFLVKGKGLQSGLLGGIQTCPQASQHRLSMLRSQKRIFSLGLAWELPRSGRSSKGLTSPRPPQALLLCLQ